jgi:AcrR family transcriptional regulator
MQLPAGSVIPGRDLNSDLPEFGNLIVQLGNSRLGCANPEARAATSGFSGSALARRPGMTKPKTTARDRNMSSDQTRSAILAAAERLYADRGFGDVTLRDIVAEANVNLAAVNYHFGSKDELIAELFVTRSLQLNRERLRQLRAAEEKAGSIADIADILRALIGPSLRGCLGPDSQHSTAARFMIRVNIESVPAIRRIRNREIDHLRKFIAAMRRALPGHGDVELYWGLHFALAMAQQTVRDAERLAKLSEGKCDVDDVEAVIERVVKVAVMALNAGGAASKAPPRAMAR